jgi:hypothetical protein
MEDTMHSVILRRLAADHIEELVSRAADARWAGEARRAPPASAAADRVDSSRC